MDKLIKDYNRLVREAIDKDIEIANLKNEIKVLYLMLNVMYKDLKNKYELLQRKEV